MMKYKYLGNSGLKVSELAYGNWLTHGSQVTIETATKTVHAALDAGITTFDTADVYSNGKAETVLAKALRGQRREGLELFSKVYWPTGEKGHNDCGLSRKHIMESINSTLKRLDTDYVDVYFAHRYDVETPIEETMAAFADVVRSGKALYIGVSEWTAEQIRYAHDFSRQMGFQVIASQPQYSMLHRVIEAEVIPASRDMGISQVVWSPLAQGVLTGKYVPGKSAPARSRAKDARGGAQMIERYMDQTIIERVADLKPVAKDLGITMSQMALAWVLHNDNVTSAIIGASKATQIKENAAACGVELPAETYSTIDNILGDVITTDPRLTWENAPHERPC